MGNQCTQVSCRSAQTQPLQAGHDYFKKIPTKHFYEYMSLRKAKLKFKQKTFDPFDAMQLLHFKQLIHTHSPTMRQHPEFKYLLNPNIRHSAMHFFLRFVGDNLLLPPMNQEDYFPILVYVNGQSQCLVQDGFIPTIKQIPLFGKTDTSDIWMWLVQKAWLLAKNGTYSAVDQNDQVLALGGRVVFAGWLSTGEWKKAEGHTIALKSSLQEARDYDLIPGCLYKLDKKLMVKDKTVYKLINPSHSISYKRGRLQFGSEQAHQLLQQHPTLELKQDSDQFYMYQEEIQQLFDQYYLVVNGWDHVIPKSYTLTESVTYMKLLVDRSAPAIIYLYQHSFHNQFRQNEFFCQAIFDIFRDDEQMTLIGEGSNNSYFGGKTIFATEQPIITLEPGEYIVHINLKGNIRERNVSFNVMSEQPVLVLDCPQAEGARLKRSMFKYRSVRDYVWLKHRCLIKIKNQHPTTKKFIVTFSTENDNLRAQDSKERMESTGERGVVLQVQGEGEQVVSLCKHDLSKGNGNIKTKVTIQ